MSDTTTTTTNAPAARVPQLTGVPANEAHDRALDAGVLAVAENAFHTGAGRAHVGRQEPEAGHEGRHQDRNQPVCGPINRGAQVPGPAFDCDEVLVMRDHHDGVA